MAIGESTMPFTTWIRDLFGIRKDVVDIKKARLETEKLEDEKRARNLITPATMDDVKKYDPKYKVIQRKIDDGLNHISLNGLKILVLLIFAFEIVKGLFAFIKNLLR